MSTLDPDSFSTGAGLNLWSRLPEDDRQALVGRELDGYRITDFIAEGGMGRVYRAERVDGSFEREVAIKLSAFSSHDSTLRQRFMREQLLLAGLNHPHITQLYDARVAAEGWPYIVMELVDGSPLTRYCEAASLSLPARVRLMLDVVDAVAFAHANLVVHRDIKPSNVLVTAEGKVKLLDFGVATLLEDEQGKLTQTNAMTPRYASPEQLLGRPITIASDIYQLGLLLAEVLTGHSPTEGITLTDAIKRAADDQSLTLPGELRKTLPPDLALVIEQCLRVEPEGRFADANALGRDLRAYLGGYPVSAAGQRPGYRLRKFVRRNRLSVAGAGLAVLALMAATVITSWQMLEARRQEALAVYQQQRVQASNEFYSLLMEELGDGPITSLELLDRGRSLLVDQFGSGQPFMAAMLLDVSRRYGSLGERQREAELLAEAERLAGANGDNDVLAAVLCRRARASLMPDPEQSAERLAKGWARYTELSAPSIGASVECLRARSLAEYEAGRSDAALATLVELQRLLDAHPAPGINLRGLVLNDIAFFHHRQAQHNRAIGYLEQLLVLLDSNGRGGTLSYQRVAANRAVVLENLGRYGEALDAFEDLLDRMQTTGFRGRGTAPLLAQYGALLVSTGRVDEAELVLRQGIAISATNAEGRVAARLQLALASVHLARDDFRRAAESLDLAESYIPNPAADRVLAMNLRVQRLKVLRGRGDLDAAALAADELLREAGYPTVRETPGLVSALIETAEIYRQKGDYRTALERSDRLIEHLRKHNRPGVSGGIHLGRALAQRGELRLHVGDRKGAVADIEAGLPMVAQALGEDHSEVASIRMLLARSTASGSSIPPTVE